MGIWSLIVAPTLAVPMLANTSPVSCSDVMACPAPSTSDDQSLGVSLNPTAGFAFVWRRRQADGWGYQAGAGISLSSDLERSGASTLGVGWRVFAEGQKQLSHLGWWRLYGLAGIQSAGIPRVQYPQPVPMPAPSVPPTAAVPVSAMAPPTPTRYSEHEIDVTCGLGLAFGPPRGISVAVELPLVFGYRIAPTAGFSRFAPEPSVMVFYTF